VFYELRGIWSDEVTVRNVKTEVGGISEVIGNIKAKTTWNYKTKEISTFQFTGVVDEFNSEQYGNF
jgi:hypothetical protein